MNDNCKLLILPEIFGVNEQIMEIGAEFNQRFGIATSVLDYLYAVANTSVNYDFTDWMEAVTFLRNLQPQAFINFLKSELDRHEKEGFTNFIILGFCMGGGLAYLTGIDPRVNGIISFYGTRADQLFYNNQSNLDNLVQNRPNDECLKVLSFFGAKDSSTPEQYQNLIQQTLQTARIDYTEIVYPDADHAFMNHRRPERFNPEAKEKAMLEIEKFLNQLI